MSDEAKLPDVERRPTLTVGVAVERRKAKNRWQDHVWQPVEILLPPPPLAPWTVMRQDENVTRFYAGSHTMQLYPPETISYRENLVADQPSIYVVLRPDPSTPAGMRLEHVGPSPADAEAYMMSGVEIVDKVPMPAEVTEWLAAYVETFHVEHQFRKRRRDKAGGRRNRDPDDAT
jgi:hypothetical protein